MQNKSHLPYASDYHIDVNDRIFRDWIKTIRLRSVDIMLCLVMRITSYDSIVEQVDTVSDLSNTNDQTVSELAQHKPG